MKDRVLRLFEFMNVFDTKKNIKRTILILVLSSILILFTRVEAIYNATSENIMIPMVMPFVIMFIGLLTVLLSALLIQYTWFRRVNFGFALQFSAMIDFFISISAFLLYMVNGVIIESKAAIVTGYGIIFCLIIAMSYAVAHYTTNREEVVEDQDMFEESDFVMDDDHHQEEKGDKKSITLTFLGNIFRSFVIIFAKPFIVVGLGIGANLL